MLEKDLEIYDVWESPNKNLFIKISDNYSIAIGEKGEHEPLKGYYENQTLYVKRSETCEVKKVGRIIFD